jgi:hypothetical protein
MNIIIWLILGVVTLVSLNSWAKKTNRLWCPPGCLDDLLLVRWSAIIIFWPLAIFVLVLITLLTNHYEKKAKMEKLAV